MIPPPGHLDASTTMFPASPIAPDEIAGDDSLALSAMALLNSYAHIFVAAFIVTLLVTPVVRRLAIGAGVIDRPDLARKQHAYPIAYLGGVAVFLGVLVAIVISYLTDDEVTADYLSVPIAVIIGMVAIASTGLADDVWGWDPRLKIAGQLVAAAALAINDIGVRVAEGLFTPLLGGPDEVLLSLGTLHLLNSHMYYWTGTALIALFVLGGCNATNLIDGLDGLLSGVVAIMATGLLAICLLIAPLDHRALDTAKAEAMAAAVTVQVRVDEHRARTGEPPADLASLTVVGATGALPQMPPGWTYRYDAALAEVTVRDERRAVALAGVETVNAALQRYESRFGGRSPPRLPSLVSAGDLEVLPRMPVGYTLRHDPNAGRARLTREAGSMTGARVVLCLALLGAVLGFLPHNFNPASIFLGDCGSLLVGYLCVVIILLLGDRGQTHLVFAGLIVFALPIMDTTLAIIRRRLAGSSLSAADDQHIHHQIRRAVGGVKRAVLSLYVISAVFAGIGVSLVALVLSGLRVRFIYAIALVLFGGIGVVAVKEARRKQILLASQAAAKKGSA